LTGRTYSRVYHEIVDDPKFQGVYYDNDTLATWLRMLLVADAMYPHSAPLPRRNRSVRLLIEVGLIAERPNNRYVIAGLEAERERRSDAGRNAAAARWALPVEQSKDEKNKAGSIASNGAPPTTFMGWKGAGLHDGRHGATCSVCHP